MNDKESRIHQKFVRVRQFGNNHAADFAVDSLYAHTLTDLSAVITEVETLSAAEFTARGDALSGTTGRGAGREELRDRLQAIARTVRVMEDEFPGISEKFRVPRNNNGNLLLSTARSFLAEATPLKARLIAHAMPDDFLEELQAAIAAFEAATHDQTTGLGNHIAARVALDEALSRGIELVRKLDAIVRNKYAHDRAVLAEWTSASHTERAPRRSKAAEPPPATSGQ